MTIALDDRVLAVRLRGFVRVIGVLGILLDIGLGICGLAVPFSCCVLANSAPSELRSEKTVNVD